MQHLWIIDNITSTTIYYKNYSQRKIDPDLVSGLLSALHNLSEVELKQEGIESINMGGLSWVYLDDKIYKILFIAADARGTNPQVLRFRLDIIKNAFFDKYKLTPEKWKEIWKGDIREFSNFDEIVDLYINQWMEAEKVVNTAELFDLIGVFQQILNLNSNIVKYKFRGRKYSKIISSIHEKIDNLKSIEQFQNDSEITKIDYNEEKGWNIININPYKVNGENLLKVLLYITKYIKELIIENLGKDETVLSFSEELFPFLVNNWDLIKKLNLDKKLLNIFLL